MSPGPVGWVPPTSIPDTSSSTTPVAHLVLIGAVLPAIFATLDTCLLASWRLVPLMAALIAEVGLMGPLCARFIRPPWLMWLIYAWVWLIMDMMVVALTTREPSWGESISLNTLPVGLLCGQLGLVLVWAAFGTTRWNVRWPAAFLLAVAILVPVVWHRMHPTELPILVSLQSAMLVTVCWWLAWMGFRLVRIKSAGDATLLPSGAGLQSGANRAAGPRESQFQLRDLLVWTTALAIALAVARAINYWSLSFATWEYLKSIVAANRTGDFLLGSPTAAILTAAVLLVALWASLGEGPTSLRWSFCVAFIAALGLTHGLIDYYQKAWVWTWAPPLWSNWDIFWHLEQALITWHCLTGGMLFAALLMVRALGYRLCRLKNPAPNGPD